MAPMLPDGRRLGAHLALGDGMVKAAERAVEIGLDALQVFSDNPTAWGRRAEPNPEIGRFRAVLHEHDIAPLAIHGSYLINLAGWDETLRARSIGLLAAELVTARTLGARFVNIHTGSHRGTDVHGGIRRLTDGVGRAFDHAAGAADEAGGPAGIDPVVVLENASGGGWSLGVDLDQWTAIADALDGAGIGRDRVAFCLDTAHLWGAGHDLADPAATDRILTGFDQRIGIDRLVLMHLNDSKAALGGRMDRHEHIAAGRIGPAGIRHLLTHPALAQVTYLLETPGMDEGYDAINVARARALARGEDLDPLPPEAFELRGSRVRAATPAPVAATAS
jgi:deoxyribonuclease IV